MTNKKVLCSVDQFSQLLELIKKEDYTLLGPQVRNNVIILDILSSAFDLPIGWQDEQRPGYYRLKKRSDGAYFSYNLGPHSWKQFLFPPHEKLFSTCIEENKLSVEEETDPPIQKMAFIGVHPCELKAIEIQDKVFNNKISTYRQYEARKKELFVLALHCTHSVETCFCSSMGTGPEASGKYDLALTELIDNKSHSFLLEIGSERGNRYAQQLNLQEASFECIEKAKQLIQANIAQMKRNVDNDVHTMLLDSWDYQRWNQVGARCVNCTNCTMVCPTCFCSETTDIGSIIENNQNCRCQSWDSCFTLSHSYIHGGSIRQTSKSRYRQWLTHKFGTWHDQFGTSGCVGCGRCITWCPVGIDVTEELHELKKESE